MIAHEDKIIIKDLSAKVNNPREEYEKEQKSLKPFIFKGYTSELERIKKVSQKNKLLYNLPDYPDEKKEHSKLKSNKKASVSQPNINFHINEENSNNNINKNKNKLIINTKKISNSVNSSPIYRINENEKILNQNSIKRGSVKKSEIRRDSIMQPEMRFKPRTDLERVYDAITEKYTKEGEKEIVKRQLINIDLFSYKKPNELLKINSSYFLPELKNSKILPLGSQDIAKIENQKTKNIYKNPKVYFEPKKNKNKSWVRNINLNHEAKNFLNDFHIKTHFKATEEMAELISSEPSRKTKLLIPNLYSIHNNKKIKEQENITDVFNFEKDYENDSIENNKNNKDNDDSENSIEVLNNPVLKGKKEINNEKSLEILSKLAFNDSYGYMDKFQNKEMNKENGKEKKKKVNYFLDNSQKDGNKIIKMAKKVLNDCKIISNKSHFNNTSLKARNGKTMITKGMSVVNFLDKYKLEI